MRTWNRIGCVALGLVLGLGCGTSATKTAPSATNLVQPPPEVLVTISLGPDRTLDGLRGFANAVQPGMGAMLTPELVRRTLGGMSGAGSLDGLDPTAPIYVLGVDGGAGLKGMAIVGKVADEQALVAGLGGAGSVIEHGWGVIGPKPIVTKVARFALATLPSQPMVTSPTAVVYVPNVVTRYRAEIDAGRKLMVAQLAATQGSGQMTALMQSYFDGMYSAVTDSEQLVVTLDVTNDVGAIILAMVAKPGSRLAKFIATQRPSDYGLLAKLPATQAPMLFAGHIESGPYRQGMLEMFGAMFSQGGNKDLVETMDQLMKAATGEIAMTMQMGVGKPISMVQLFGVADQKVVDKSIDRLLDLFKNGRTIEYMGTSTTLKTHSTSTKHDGVSLRGYDVTYDYSKAPAETREALEKMLPGGTAIPARIATFDTLALLTMGSDPTAALDAARGRGSRFTASAPIADFLTGSRARKDSFMLMMDLGMLAGIPGPDRSILMSAGFADRTAHLRIALPASTIRALAGQSTNGPF